MWETWTSSRAEIWEIWYASIRRTQSDERNSELESKDQNPVREEERDYISKVGWSFVDSASTSVSYGTSANRVQPTKERKNARSHATYCTDQTRMQIAQQRHYVTVKREHMNCMMCAQMKSFDKLTIFLAQQCPAAEQTYWELRIQHLKSETDN